jgi:hypothetical protein
MPFEEMVDGYLARCEPVRLGDGNFEASATHFVTKLTDIDAFKTRREAA